MSKLLVLPFIFAAGCAVGTDASQTRLRTTIEARQDSLHRCYAQALVNDPDMEGTMRTVVRVSSGSDKIDMVEPSGESQVTNPKLHGPLHRCMQRVLLGAKIGATPIGDDLFIEYAFHFVPGKYTPGQTSFETNDDGSPIRATVTVDPNVNVDANVEIGPNGVRGNANVTGGVNVRGRLGVR